MKCAKCGSENTESSNYCMKCGNSLMATQPIPIWYQSWFILIVSIILPPMGFVLLYMSERPKKNKTIRYMLLFVLLGYCLIWTSKYFLDSDSEKTNISAENTVENSKVGDVKEIKVVENTPKSDSSEKPSDEFEYKDLNVKYIKHEIATNDVDETVLVVYYEFTNNSNENKSFSDIFSTTCFQEGIEIDKSWFYLNDEAKNMDKEIQPGKTIVMAETFIIGENKSNVDLEIESWFSDKKLLEIELALY